MGKNGGCHGLLKSIDVLQLDLCITLNADCLKGITKCTILRGTHATQLIVELYRRHRQKLIARGRTSLLVAYGPRIVPITLRHHRWQLVNEYPHVLKTKVGGPVLKKSLCRCIQLINNIVCCYNSMVLLLLQAQHC